MNLRIKYLTSRIDMINDDLEKCKDEQERIVLLLDIKSFLVSVVIRLENEIIMPISYYKEHYEVLKQGNEEVMLLIDILCEVIKENSEHRKKLGFSDGDYYGDDLLKEKVAEEKSRIKRTIKYVDTQIELIRQRMKLKPSSVTSEDDEINRAAHSKIKWKGNKTEFAQFVNKEYKENTQNYKSLRDASNKLFEQYEFEDKKWTKENCYGMVRKN